jgi:hypothetical protein
MIDLRKNLEEYKNLTLELIKKAKNDEDLSQLINERDDILKEIGRHNYNKEDFRNIVQSLDILKLDEELKLVVRKEMVEIKKRIEQIRAARVARNGYRKSSESIKLFMNKA